MDDRRIVEFSKVSFSSSFFFRHVVETDNVRLLICGPSGDSTNSLWPKVYGFKLEIPEHMA